MACDGPSSLENAPLDGFSDEQRRYLMDMLGQLDLAAFWKPAPAATAPADEPARGRVNGAQISVFGTPYDDLCKQEQLKLAEHPDEMWPKLRAHADAAKMPEGGDVFMFKHHGMFNVQPAQPGFMCRMRIPGCKLRGDQLGRLGDLAEQLAGGYAHVTTRGNLQVREIRPENMIRVIETMYDIGLTSKGSGGDSVRNITANPTAGFDPQELMDLTPHAKRIHQHVLHTPSLHGIPRKFNIAFDGGGVISALVDTNDLGFVAYRLTDEYLAANPELAEQAPDGIVCRILLGGITGHKDFAISSGFACLPDQMVDLCVAVLNVFTEHADRTNRKKARLKYILDSWGHEKFTETCEDRLDFDLLRLPPEATHERGPIDRLGHIGVHEQADPGKRYLGVSLTLGRMSPEQMRGLADVAQRYGSNDVRLTVWQNLIIPDVPVEKVDEAVDAIRGLGLDISASTFKAGVVACTGKFACQYASAHTKESAASAADHLDEKFTLDRPINIHLTGCPHSCAQHYIGDIGLVGSSTKDGREAYNVVLGGGADHDQGIARPFTGPVPADELNPFLEGVIGSYLEHRAPEESFLDFTRRHDDDQLQTLLMPAEDPAAVATPA
ncbi:MAG: NirA family protein [Planctomycetota bacterium]